MRENSPLFNFWLNIVHYPRHMSAYMLPIHEKDRVKEKLKAFDWKHLKNDVDALIEFMYGTNQTMKN